jgi:L-lactate dehydrogenase complex protein LldG
MNNEWKTAISRSTANNVPEVWRMLDKFPYIRKSGEELRAAKLKVLSNIDDYVKQTMDAVAAAGGVAHFARDAEEARRIVHQIVGKGKTVIMGKSNVTYEVGLRKWLQEKGNDVWETDFGEYLLQISNEAPSHIITVALHMTREVFGRNIHDFLDSSITEKSTPAEMAASVRAFLMKKYEIADIGITGANAVAADTGSVVLVENEGNIRMTTVKPQIHISVTGVDKIVPALPDALNEAMVQAAYAGSYPPTYINVTTGPSSTGDIEAEIIRPATGPREFHLVLVDNGRLKTSKDPELREALLCIRCGRCYYACPTYHILGREWGVPPYSGPAGVMWNSIVRDDPSPSHLCTHSGGCREVCPMGINIPRVMEYLKWSDITRQNSKK